MRIFEALRPHSRWYREVDAYVDMELFPGTKARFEAHLRGCTRCTDAVTGRQRLKSAIQTMPAFAAPRSFRLSAETAIGQSLRPADPPPGRLALRLSMALAGLAIVGLVSTVVVDLNGSGRGAASTASTAASSTFQASSSAEGAKGALPLVPDAAPQSATPRSLPATGSAIGVPQPETVHPPADTGQKAVAPAVPAHSTGDDGRLCLIEVGFALFAVASVVTSARLVRKQRRTSR